MPMSATATRRGRAVVAAMVVVAIAVGGALASGKPPPKGKQIPPAPQDDPPQASSSSSASTSSTSSRPARRLARAAAQREIVSRPETARAMGRGDRDATINALADERGMPAVDGAYRLDKDQLIATGLSVSQPSQWDVGDPPRPGAAFAFDSKTLETMLGALQRAGNGAARTTPERLADYIANQEIVRQGFVLLPNREQLLALSHLVELQQQAVAKGTYTGEEYSQLPTDEREAVFDYLLQNKLAAADAKARYEGEMAQAMRDEAQSRVEREASFGAREPSDFDAAQRAGDEDAAADDAATSNNNDDDDGPAGTGDQERRASKR